jgi:hypothetical protein
MGCGVGDPPNANKYYIVAAQMYELVTRKIPQIVWAESGSYYYCRLIASLLFALLLNTSLSFTLLRINCLVSTVVTHS